MTANSGPISVKRLTRLSPSEITQFNAVRDPGTEWDETQGLRFLENPDNALFLAYADLQVVGFLTAYKLQRLDRQKCEVLVYEVEVALDFRRQGAGRALIQKVKDWGTETGAVEVWVLTNRSNAAGMALYKSMGGLTESDDEQMFTFSLQKE